MRRTRLRQRGKAAEYAAEVADDRLEWAASMPQVCMWRGCKAEWPGLQVHEMVRRSHASRKWWHRANALLVCERCHAGELASAPLRQQLACKYAKDPKHFDLAAVLRLRDERAMQYVEFIEMAPWLVFNPDANW